MELSAAALWINTTFAGFDMGLTLAIHKLYFIAGWFFTPLFEFISFLGHDGIPLIILSVVLMFFKKTRRFGIAMGLSLAIGAIITNCVLKVLIARPRPYADTASVFHQLWLTVGQNMESDKSFPSGHTTAAFASMTAVFLVGRKNISWTAFIFAVLMAIARVYLVVHFPSDVVAGIIVGLAAGFLGTFASRKLPEVVYDYEFRPTQTQKGKHEKCSDSEN